jgi:hypothetical protein
MLQLEISHDMQGVLKVALAGACQVRTYHGKFGCNVYLPKFHHPSHNTNKGLVEEHSGSKMSERSVEGSWSTGNGLSALAGIKYFPFNLSVKCNWQFLTA